MINEKEKAEATTEVSEKTEDVKAVGEDTPKAESTKTNETSETQNKADKTVKESEDIKEKAEKVPENKETEPVREAPKADENQNEQIMFATAEHQENHKKSDDETVNSNEGVVFATTQTPIKKSVSPESANPKRKFPVIPVAAVAAALCVAVSAAIIAVSASRNTLPVAADNPSQVSSAALNDSEPESINITSQTENDKKDLPVIIEQPIEISEVDTTSIIFGDNVTVEGISLSGKTLAQAFDAMQDKLKDLRENISIKINCDGENLTLTQDDFEFDTDIASVLIQAYHYSRGELAQPNVEITQNGDTTDFKVTSVLNKNSVGGAVKKAADKFDIQPVNASVTKFDPTAKEKFTYKDGQNGFLIDQKDLSNKLTEVLKLSEKEAALSITKKETAFDITLAKLKANTKLIASTYTTAANVWASNHNMELAIQTASGTVVQPGETFSFNKMTGDTTNGALGYVPSTAIVRGEYVQEYGGGICQASTTLYLCALKADMEVVERWAHAYPSVYADRGLDATVDYGNLDMKFKNTKDYAIYIATYVYDYDYDGRDELLVEMYGPLSTEYDEIVPVGWVTSAGSDGYYAKGAKVYFKNGKEIKREYTPGGSYDYKYDTYQSALSRIPADPNFGPTNVTPTMKAPAVFSPDGCGSNAPIAYGTAAEYLKQVETASSNSVEQSSVQQSSAQQSSTQQSSTQQSSAQQSSTQQSSVQQSSTQQSSVQQSSAQQSSTQQSSAQQSSTQQSSAQQSSTQQSSTQQSSTQQSSTQQSSTQQSSSVSQTASSSQTSD